MDRQLSTHPKAVAARAYYAKNRDAIRAKDRAKPKTDEKRAADAARQKASYYRQNKGKWLEYKRRMRGLPPPTRPTPESCEICGKSPPSGRALDLDHCHATGKFRGWLCNKCNAGLGALGDDISGLLRAIKYLRQFEESSRG